MSDEGKPRLDKWLWAARFFKTRALAKAASEGGRVHDAGARSEPSKEPRIGDQLQIRQGYDQRTVVIRAISMTRRGAPEAQRFLPRGQAPRCGIRLCSQALPRSAGQRFRR